VVFICHNCFGINSIYAFQLVKCFIQIICQLVIIIQKVIDVQLSSKHFIYFVTFIHVNVSKYFPRHSYVAWGYLKNILSMSSKYSKNIHSYS
jgi:hypothetical protein